MPSKNKKPLTNQRLFYHITIVVIITRQIWLTLQAKKYDIVDEIYQPKNPRSAIGRAQQKPHNIVRFLLVCKRIKALEPLRLFDIVKII